MSISGGIHTQTAKLKLIETTSSLQLIYKDDISISNIVVRMCFYTNNKTNFHQNHKNENIYESLWHMLKNEDHKVLLRVVFILTKDFLEPTTV